MSKLEEWVETKKLSNTLKYRWKMSPTWVKVLDISCWIGLVTVVGVLWL